MIEPIITYLETINDELFKVDAFLDNVMPVETDDSVLQEQIENGEVVSLFVTLCKKCNHCDSWVEKDSCGQVLVNAYPRDQFEREIKEWIREMGWLL